MQSRQVMSRSGIAVVCVAAFAACSGETASPAGVEVTDSAGVEIVFSSTPAWPDGESWTVSDAPSLQIGSMDGEEPHLLSRVVGVARLSDGRVVVANQGDNTIRFYDADGRYLMRGGGSGEGPGEFFQLWRLYRTEGRLHASQGGGRPVLSFDAELGEFVGSVPFTRPDGFAGASMLGMFEDGSALIGDYPQGLPAQPGAYTMNSTLARVSPSGAIDTVGSFPTATFVSTEARYPIWQEYAPAREVTAHGLRVYHAFPTEYAISVRDTSGTLVRSVRRAWEPIPVSEADKAAYRDPLLNPDIPPGQTVPAVALRQWRQHAEGMVFPEHHPAFTAILLDRVGHLWVQRTDPNAGEDPVTLAAPGGWWDVFDPEGVWLGGVEMPPGFVVSEIGDDYVAGVWRDALDVEFVRVMELSKPTG